MEILTVLIRTIFFYFFITLAYRIMGKREIGQLGIIDLIVSILIAELVAISIENINDSIFNTILPIVSLVIIELLLAYASIKSKKLRYFLTGKPSLIINKGQINYKEMIRQRYSLDDLLLELRQKGIKSISQVEYALLESNGKLSIFKYNPLKIPSNYPLPLIIDGEIQKSTLKEIKRSENWLKKHLKQNNIILEKVFYAFYKSGKVFLIQQKDLII